MSTPISAADLDAVVRTIYGEARGESEKGMIAVAYVIKNRTEDKRWPSSPEKVVKQKYQFSSWNANDANLKVITSLSPNSAFYKNIANIVKSVWAGSVTDPTNGSVYYFAPAGMPGRKAPKWWPDAVAESKGQIQIGNHFFAGKVNTATTSKK
jgi:conjugal transfer mating pair stabilization protein TraG